MTVPFEYNFRFSEVYFFYISLLSHLKDSSFPSMAEQIHILQRRLEDNFPGQKRLCRGDVAPTRYGLCVMFQWSLLSSLPSAYVLPYV